MAEEQSVDDGGIPHLAERLNSLFERIPQPGGGPLYSNDAAARQLTEMGIKVSGVHLSQMRAGKRTNPSARLLAGIADMFDVPLAYFFDADQAKRISAELDLLVGIRNVEVRGILSRTAGLSEHGLASLTAILDQIRHVEGLDDEQQHRR